MNLYSEIIFPKYYDWVLGHQGFESSRTQILKKVRGRILEIGIGTGLNLDHYPSWVKKISAVEPNPGMRRKLGQKIAIHYIEVDCRAGVAESIPFADHSFDTVVSTFTLCSVSDLRKALDEIRRVLAQGGQFIFMDHGLSREPKVARTQRLLNPVQSLMGCGCKLVVDVRKELLQAGFKTEHLDILYVGTGPKILGNVYKGAAFPV